MNLLLLCIQIFKCKEVNILSFYRSGELSKEFDLRKRNFLISEDFNGFFKNNFNFQRSFTNFFKKFEIKNEIFGSKCIFYDDLNKLCINTDYIDMKHTFRKRHENALNSSVEYDENNCLLDCDRIFCTSCLLRNGNSQLKFLDFYYDYKNARLDFSDFINQNKTRDEIKNRSSLLTLKRSTYLFGHYYKNNFSMRSVADIITTVGNQRSMHLSNDFRNFFKINVDEIKYDVVSEDYVHFLMHLIYQMTEAKSFFDNLLFTGSLGNLNHVFDSATSNGTSLDWKTYGIIATTNKTSHSRTVQNQVSNVYIKNNNDILSEHYDLNHFGNFFYFLQHICHLSDTFFMFDVDASPSDLFSKVITILITLKQFLYIDPISNRFVSSTKNLSKLNEILKSQYLNFMFIYRNQYALIHTQYCHYRRESGIDYKAEEFLVTDSILHTIHCLVIILCNVGHTIEINLQNKDISQYDKNTHITDDEGLKNINSESNEKPFRLLAIDNEMIDSLEMNANFSAIDDKPDYSKPFPDFCGIVNHGMVSRKNIQIAFKKSLTTLIQLPVEFYFNDMKLGISQWSKIKYNRIDFINEENEKKENLNKTDHCTEIMIEMVEEPDMTDRCTEITIERVEDPNKTGQTIIKSILDYLYWIISKLIK